MHKYGFMRLILIISFCISCFFAKAQTITAAEFFVNTDPGVGNGTAITVPSGATSVFTATVPTTSLPNGFHFVGIRTKDSDGNWGLFETRGFYISSTTNNAGNIAAAEFFIDTDPGVGNGTAIAVPSGSTSNFVATVPTTSLAGGFHFVAIRTKDTDGIWSLFETRGFYISSTTVNAGNIIAAEFFVDTDPGVGNGTAIAVPSGSSSTFVTTVPTTSLTNGFHFIAIRTKDATGNWGLFENRGFYISSATANVGNITAAEFFIDTDPGVGNGTSIVVSPGSSSAFVATVPTTSLASGFHFIAIRTKDADGNWGLFENRGFYISTATTNMADITAGEYFFDTDPGIGNGAAFNFTTPGQTVTQAMSLNVPVGLSQGNHLLILRVKDANGFWSLFDTARTIAVSGFALPLRLLSFTGRKVDTKTVLNWKTDNEVNTSHFEIERSKNGVEFNKIGIVTAINASGFNNYSFEDTQPFSGINFYRLKQVDIDGKFTYSSIIRLLFEGYGKPLTVFPNPASSFVQFDFSGKQSTVFITLFDGMGKLVKQLSLTNQIPLQIDISALPAGSYYVQVSDGVMNEGGRFIKK
jgi:Secretion system C-terminal sorting domain